MELGLAILLTDYSIQPAALGASAEERGFESLFLAEHTHIPVSRETPYPGGGELPREYSHTIDPFVGLTAAATATERLKVGTGVCLVIERDPIVTAKEVATLDHVSGGRFLFGVGAGWNREEMLDHGTDPKTRWGVMRERIEAMKAIWTQEEPEYHGEFVNFDRMKQWPKPHQTPHPPIIVGGAFPYAARRAIRYGDGWIPRADRLEKAGVGVLIDKFRQMATEAGRDPASLPITIFRVPEELDRLKYCEEIGIDRVVFSLPAEGKDKLMPIIDRWAELKHRMGS
jgi:probable F420-dependent oxidoreductase